MEAMITWPELKKTPMSRAPIRLALLLPVGLAACAVATPEERRSHADKLGAGAALARQALARTRVTTGGGPGGG